MGILDKIVEWIAEQVMNILNLFTNSILQSLGIDLSNFRRYFPAADTLYVVFVALGLGLLILNFLWGVFKNFGLGIGMDAEHPGKLAAKTFLFVPLVFYAGNLIDIGLNIGGKPYNWILDDALPEINFADFNSVLLTSIGGMVSGSVLLISLILLVVLAWNYLKLLLEAAERYIVLGVLAFTAPVAIATGASASSNSIFKSWCRMFASQIFLLIMNAWCLKIFVSMVGAFIANPLATGENSNLFVWFLCAIGFLKVSTKMDSILGSLGLNSARTGGGILGDAMIAMKAVTGISRGLNKGISGNTSTSNPLEKNSSNIASTFSGGLTGIANRKISQSASASISSGSAIEKGSVFSSLSGKAMKESFGKEGGFAASVIGGIATDPSGKNQISGTKGEEAFSSYFGMDAKDSACNEALTGFHDPLSETAAPGEWMSGGIPMNNDMISEDGQPTAEEYDPSLANHSDISTSMDMAESTSDPFGASLDQMEGGSLFSSTDPISASTQDSISPANGSYLEGETGLSAGTVRNTSNKSSASDGADYQSTGRFQSSAFQNIFGSSPDSQYKNIHMGGGQISGVEFSQKNPNGIRFSMYHSGKYAEPEGTSTTIQSKDGASWFLQYAEPTIKKTPISEENGKVSYKESIVHRLPPKPRELGR